MPVTTKQKSKTNRSIEADMISDVENLDVRIGSGNYEWEESEFESPSYVASIDPNSTSTTNSRVNEIRGFTGNG